MLAYWRCRPVTFHTVENLLEGASRRWPGPGSRSPKSAPRFAKSAGSQSADQYAKLSRRAGCDLWRRGLRAPAAIVGCRKPSLDLLVIDGLAAGFCGIYHLAAGARITETCCCPAVTAAPGSGYIRQSTPRVVALVMGGAPTNAAALMRRSAGCTRRCAVSALSYEGELMLPTTAVRRLVVSPGCIRVACTGRSIPAPKEAEAILTSSCGNCFGSRVDLTRRRGARARVRLRTTPDGAVKIGGWRLPVLSDRYG